jgi:hypothetical protein
MDNYHFTSRQGFGVLSSLNGTSPCDGSLIEYLNSLLRMKILGVVPPLVAHNAGATFFLPPCSTF